jgi:hypothetical protein
MPEFSDEDPWISTTSPIGPKRLHALGLITLRWNVCQFGLFRIFRVIVALPDMECWALAHGLGDIAIAERITAVATLRKLHPKLCDLIADVLAYYDICRQNRNFLTHAWFDDASEPGSAKLLRKSKRIDSAEPQMLLSELVDLGRVADELSSFSDHLLTLEVALRPTARPPSREKLKPPKLLWEPPPPIRTKSKHRPESSSKWHLFLCRIRSLTDSLLVAWRRTAMSLATVRCGFDPASQAKRGSTPFIAPALCTGVPRRGFCNGLPDAKAKKNGGTAHAAY